MCGSYQRESDILLWDHRACLHLSLVVSNFQCRCFRAVKYVILSNSRRSKLHAVIDCLFFFILIHSLTCQSFSSRLNRLTWTILSLVFTLLCQPLLPRFFTFICLSLFLIFTSGNQPFFAVSAVSPELFRIPLTSFFGLFLSLEGDSSFFWLIAG